MGNDDIVSIYICMSLPLNLYSFIINVIIYSILYSIYLIVANCRTLNLIKNIKEQF